MYKEYIFSVIITTYNRADLIKRALDSLIAQTETDWEAIIIDDGSTDDTYDQLFITKMNIECDPIREETNPKPTNDDFLVLLFSAGFLWILGSTGILGLLRYIINPEISTWLLITVLVIGFIIVWKVFIEKNK